MGKEPKEAWASIRNTISWLRFNGPEDENGEGVVEKTADAALSIIDLLERANASPPTIWWHGGNAIVLNFGGDGADNHMMTICGDHFHVHYPRSALSQGEKP